jgi:hypothetical protein
MKTGLVLGLATLLCACGDDGTTPPAIDSSVVDAPPGAIDGAVIDSDPLAPDVAVPPIDAEVPDAVPDIDAEPPTAPPVISAVAWAPIPPCMMFVPSNYTVTLTATDPDTPSGMRTYSGSVASCGIINSNPDTLSCPNGGAYGGSMTVSDPEGNSDTISFTVVPCTPGSATP